MTRFGWNLAGIAFLVMVLVSVGTAAGAETDHRAAYALCAAVLFLCCAAVCFWSAVDES